MQLVCRDLLSVGVSTAVSLYSGAWFFGSSITRYAVISAISATFISRGLKEAGLSAPLAWIVTTAITRSADQIRISNSPGEFEKILTKYLIQQRIAYPPATRGDVQASLAELGNLANDPTLPLLAYHTRKGLVSAIQTLGKKVSGVELIGSDGGGDAD
jgi:hypothetical protein